MVADESCRNFKKGTNFSGNLYDYMKIGEKIWSLLSFLYDGRYIEDLTLFCSHVNKSNSNVYNELHHILLCFDNEIIGINWKNPFYMILSLLSFSYTKPIVYTILVY